MKGTKNSLKGFEICSQQKFKYVLTFDSDGEHNVNDVPRLIKKIKFKNCDLVVQIEIAKIEWQKFYYHLYLNLNTK